MILQAQMRSQSDTVESVGKPGLAFRVTRLNWWVITQRLRAFARKSWADQRGYTLIETLVAMGLFLSVLIPVGVTMGNLMLDDSVNRVASALRAGQTEVSRVMTEHDFTNGTRKIDQSFTVERSVTLSRNLVDVQIIVRDFKSPARSILTLHRSLQYP